MIDLARGARRTLVRARRRARRLSGIGRDLPVILMYHRVASPPYDPWGLCVPSDVFRDQLLALRKHRTLMSMDEFADGLVEGGLPPKATVLTFDDGYSDNAATAKPLLEELGVPATIFLTTGALGKTSLFWWDELAALVLASRGAADFDFEVAEVRLAARWDAQASLPSDLKNWRSEDPTDAPRRLAYLRLWEALQRMDARTRERAMAELRKRLGERDGLVELNDELPMTELAARTLSSGVIDIGNHGRSHVPLPALPIEMRRLEVEGGRADLAEIGGGRESKGFAYPHGEWDTVTRQVVIDAGYRWAVSAHEGKVDVKHHDRFALPRMRVGDWPGPDLLRRMRWSKAA